MRKLGQLESGLTLNKINFIISFATIHKKLSKLSKKLESVT